MFALDIPDVPIESAPVMIVQTQAQPASASTDTTIGICTAVESSDESRGAGALPIRDLQIYLRNVEHKDLEDSGQWKVSILQRPVHGDLLVETNRIGAFSYNPEIDYVGADQATFLVDTGDQKYRVVYFFHVKPGMLDDEDHERSCPNAFWKISLAEDEPPRRLAGFISPVAMLNYHLQSVNVSLNFADLPGSKVGETTSDKITLDDNGAGYGWFIDATPESNDEFLPTSNPNEWIAKPGSEAAGKMDLLTVLLHEYAHALGLDHDESAHQLMSEGLQPGVRRTVSDADMAQLWSLLSEPLVADGGDPSAPFAPLGLSFFFGFARRKLT